MKYDPDNIGSHDAWSPFIALATWAFIVIVVGAFVLTGCATPPPLVTGPTTVRVEIPVKVLCIAAADVPALPAKTRVPDIAKATKLQIAAATGADLYALDVYAAQANAALLSCAQAP